MNTPNDLIDGEPEVARDAGTPNLREALATLDYHIARAIKRGDYGCASDLATVKECMESSR